MTERDDGEALRPWQEVAAELTKERDPMKLIELCEELAEALDRNKAELPRPLGAVKQPDRA